MQGTVEGARERPLEQLEQMIPDAAEEGISAGRQGDGHLDRERVTVTSQILGQNNHAEAAACWRLTWRRRRPCKRARPRQPSDEEWVTTNPGKSSITFGFHAGF
ncbi:hypothetical protein EYF80_046132 [Liparis tanakae]|uniref:Uncharacterized protein n=1 Tax=Liparis tanakae TaxID=230148 RepID=A0A4Z2FSB8_9TELE|nr:hypothetical protein EYF80_046132 [Liparis tanakae]